MGEALAIFVRYVSDKWVIEQKLVRLQILAKSLSGEEVARELISTLSVNFGISSNQLLAVMRDRASVNEVALKTVKIVYPHCLSIGCFSHTIDHVGEHFNTPILSEFITAWISLFAHSPKCRMIWKELTGKAMGSFSATRWWSRWEIMDQILVQFGDIYKFLHTEDLGSNAACTKLLDILRDFEKKAKLQIELAVVIDCGRSFVKATYDLEGDGPLVVECFDTIETVKAAIQTFHTPNLNAIVKRISESSDNILLRSVFQLTQNPNSSSRAPHSSSRAPHSSSRALHSSSRAAVDNNALQQGMTQYAKDCVQPGFDYFERHLNSSLKDALKAFKAARLFSPQKLQDIQPTARAIDALNAFPFFSSSEIDELEQELPIYLAKVIDLSPETQCLDWWKRNEHTLPFWSNAAKRVFLVQPSSAASERVFSLLNSSFSSQQQSSLQDYIETSLML